MAVQSSTGNLMDLMESLLDQQVFRSDPMEEAIRVTEDALRKAATNIRRTKIDAARRVKGLEAEKLMVEDELDGRRREGNCILSSREETREELDILRMRASELRHTERDLSEELDGFQQKSLSLLRERLVQCKAEAAKFSHRESEAANVRRLKIRPIPNSNKVIDMAEGIPRIVTLLHNKENCEA